jgi:single-strand DNA-binding protein
MHHHAANSAAKPYLSPNAFSEPTASCEERNGRCERPSNCGAFTSSLRLRFRRTPAAELHESDWVQWESSASYPVLCSVTASGPNRRPAARRRSASLTAPLRGLGSSQNKFEDRGKQRRSNFFRAPPRKHSLALGSRAHSLALPRVTRAGYGKFNETEITTMYSNKVTLIGFLGNDAEVRTNDNRSFTTFSLATKSSYKKDGKYISHTEWHRCVVFGKKLAEFAGTLKKGAHLQVEGELRSRKYDSTKTGNEETIWEIRVDSILKLDRAEKTSPEEQEASDETSLEAAA